MTRQEMFEYIMDAHRRGVTGAIIEPKRKGATLSRLKKDPQSLITVSDSKLIQMYENARQAMQSPPNKPPRTTNAETPKLNTEPPRTTKRSSKNTKETPMDSPKIHQEIAQLKEEVRIIRQQNLELQGKIADLETQLNTKNTHQETTNIHHDTHQETTKTPHHKIMGFNIRLQSKTSNGHKYVKWFASRGITMDGQRRIINIYLGDAPDQARPKIEAYLDRHPEIKAFLAEKEALA